MPERARTTATSLRSQLTVALSLVLIGPIVVAAIALGVLTPAAARSLAETAAGHDADSAVVALSAHCQAIGDAATATAREIQAYATQYGVLSRSAAGAAVRRAVLRRPEAAVAVLDAHSQVLAIGGASGGLVPAVAGGYGASCSAGRPGQPAPGQLNRAFGPLATGPPVIGAGLAERIPVNTKPGGRVGYVIFWVPLDDSALRSLRDALRAGGQLTLLPARPATTIVPPHPPRAIVLASTDPDADAAGGPLADVLAAATNRPTGAVHGLGYALRPARPDLPFQVLVTSDVPGEGLLHTLGLVVLALVVLALLPLRAIAGRLSDPTARELRTTQGELRAGRDALADTFDTFGEILRHTHDLEKLLDTIVAASIRATDAVAGVIVLLEVPTAEGGFAIRSGGAASADTPPARRALSALPRFAGRYFNELLDEQPAAPLFSVLAGAGPVVAVPLRADERVIGVLVLARGDGAIAFDALALPRLRSLSDNAGTAIHNVRLHEEARRQSVTDPLTAVGNVRALSTTLSREVDRAARFDRPLTVLMLDLDHFKQVNDTLGHAFGDLVLREFAHRLQACVREVDMVARCGGEEFAVVLLETDVDGGRLVAERILNAVRSEPFRHGELFHPVTVSIGVAAFPRHGRAAAEVLQAADEALYLAKNEGRDRCEIAGISPTPSAISQAG